MTQISGKLVNMFSDNIAKIELPPVNLSDIREGDEVWVKGVYKKTKGGNELIYFGKNGESEWVIKDNVDIIAHFPKATPEEKPAELPSELHLNPDGKNHWMFLQDTLNQLIRYVKELK